MLRQSTIWLMRGLAAITFLCVLLACLLGIWGRLWLGDHLESFRPRIEAAISEKAQIQTHIAKLEVVWHGLIPEFVLKDIRLQDQAGRVDLSLDQINVRLSLWGLLNGTIDFASLEIDRPKLNVVRRPDGRFLLAGILIPLNSDEPGIPFIDWLLNQHEVDIHDGILNWEDQLSGSPVAAFPQFELRLQGQGERHRFKLSFSSPAEFMRAPELYGDFHAQDSAHVAEWSGTVGGSVAFIDLAKVRHILPLPDPLQSRLNALAPSGVIQDLKVRWNGASDRSREFNLEAKLTDVSFQSDQKLPALEHLTGNIQADQNGGRAELDAQDFKLTLPSHFQRPLTVRRLQSRARWIQEGAGTLVTIEQCRIEDPDVVGHVEGTLKLNADQGQRMAHLRAALERAEIAAIPRFLPTDIEPDARHWLSTSLKAGQARGVTMELDGNLKSFPFKTKEQGHFKVHVPLEGVTLDYADAWPIMTNIRGELDFDGAALNIHASEAAQGTLLAREVVGTIPDLDADHAILTIQGKIRGPLQSGLDLISASPLKKSLGALPKLFKSTGSAEVALKLEVPLSKTEDTKVQGDLQIEAADLRNDSGDIPPLLGVKGRVQFTQDQVSADALTAKILGGVVHATIKSGKGAEVRIDAGGPMENAEVNHFYGEDKLTFLKGRGEWKGRFEIIQGHTNIDIQAQTLLFGQLSNIEIHKQGNDPLTIDAHGKPTVKAVLQEFVPVLVPAAEGNFDWNMSLRKVNGADTLSGGGRFMLFGKNGEVTFSGKPDALVMDFSGGLDLNTLDRVVPRIPKGALSGGIHWQATVDERPGQPFFRWSSDLRGMNIDLPAPFGKQTNEAAGLNFRITRAAPTQPWLINGRWDSILSGSAVLPSDDNPVWRRVAIKLGSGDTPATPATDAIQISGDLASFDLDAWKKAFRTHPLPSVSTPSAGASDVPITMKLNVLKSSFSHYRLSSHHVKGQYLPHGWIAESSGPQLDGTLEWSDEGPGHLSAKLNQLVLKSDPLALMGKNLATEPSDDPRQLPIVDLAAAKVEMEQRQIGRVDMHGEPDAAGWKISKLTITQAHGVLDAQGTWTLRSGQVHSAMSGEIKSPDAGLFLQDLGYPKTLARGKTSLRGQLDWPGDPGDFTVSNLNGTMELDCQSGQFLSAEPGVGRLIGLISLQSLPRRITLDFRDIFSEGFAFDSLAGRIDVKQGVLSTQNLEMKGPAARVLLSGKAWVSNETADLNVRVSPAVGNSVSFASTLVGGPVVGAATYLIQKLFSDPIDQLLTYEYQVKGPWEDPQVNRLGSKRSEK